MHSLRLKLQNSMYNLTNGFYSCSVISITAMPGLRPGICDYSVDRTIKLYPGP